MTSIPFEPDLWKQHRDSHNYCSCTGTSFYKLPALDFGLEETDNFHSQPMKGDFNCRSSAREYAETDANCKKLEHWAESLNLKLIPDPKQPMSFNSGRWRRGYNPDNISGSDRISHHVTKIVEKCIPRTQHRPIICLVSAAIKPEFIPFKRRFNFKKVTSYKLSTELDQEVTCLEPRLKSYDQFVTIMKKVSRKYIKKAVEQDISQVLTVDVSPF